MMAMDGLSDGIADAYGAGIPRVELPGFFRDSNHRRIAGSQLPSVGSGPESAFCCGGSDGGVFAMYRKIALQNSMGDHSRGGDRMTGRSSKPCVAGGSLTQIVSDDISYSLSTKESR
jgi:hypothetical protein